MKGAFLMQKLRKEHLHVMSNEQLIEYIRNAIWIVFSSGILIEVTPVKVKPISCFLKWLGKKLNSEVREDIMQLENKVDDMQLDLQQHIIEGQRRDILNFACDLMRGEKKTKEHFDSIIKLHDTYDQYLRKHHKQNGQVTLAFEYISKKYKEALHDNSFL